MTYEECGPDMNPANELGKPDMVLFLEQGSTNNLWHLSDGGMVMEDWDPSGVPYPNTMNIFSKEEVQKVHRFTREPS